MHTFTNTAAEDEKGLSEDSMNIDYFRSFSEGYLESTSGMHPSTEKEYLVFATLYFTCLHFLRSLTDFLQGDVNCRTHFPAYNLVRAKNPHALLKSIDSQYGKVQEIIDLLSWPSPLKPALKFHFLSGFS